MTKVCFTEEMKSILASMKGKTIKSFEGMFYQEHNYFEEQVKINLGTFCVNLYTQENIPALPIRLKPGPSRSKRPSLSPRKADKILYKRGVIY